MLTLLREGNKIGRNRVRGVNIGTVCVYGYNLMIKMKAVAFQTFFDFSNSSLVSVSKIHSMKPVSMSVTFLSLN